MNGYTFRLVILAGRFAEKTILPACSALNAQDFFDITVVSGVTPVKAVQDLFLRYGIKLPETAVKPLDTDLTQGLVLLAVMTQEEADQLPMLHDFELQRTDGALARAWVTGRVQPDFFTLMGLARQAYEGLARQRKAQATRDMLLA